MNWLQKQNVIRHLLNQNYSFAEILNILLRRNILRGFGGIDTAIDLRLSGAPGDTNIPVEWTYLSTNPTDGFILFYGFSPDNYTNHVVIDGADRSVNVTSLDASKTYFFRLLASSQAFGYSYSNELTAMTDNSEFLPPTFGIITSTSIEVLWGGEIVDAIIAKWNIEYGTTEGGPYPGNIEILNPAIRNYTVTGLTANTDYYFRIKATTTEAAIAYSPEAQTTTSAAALGGHANWVRSIVAGFNCLPADIVSDTDDNAIACGVSDQTSDFGGGAVGQGNLWGWTAKYSSVNAFLLAKIVSSNPGSHRVNAIAVNTDDNSLYITGDFIKTVNFGDGNSLTAYDPYNLGNKNMFVVKYASDGTCVWAKAFGTAGTGTSGVLGKAICVDSANGDVFAVGTFFGTNQFGDHFLTSSTSGVNMAVLKISADDGSTDIAIRYGSANQDNPSKMVFDDLNNRIVVCGQSTSTSDYGDGVKGFPGGQGFFSFYATATLLPAGTSQVFQNATLRDIAVDSGFIYTTGEFATEVDLGDGVIRRTPWNGNGGFFIAKYNGDYTLAWGKVYGVLGDAGHSIVASSGLVTIVGKAAGLTDFENSGIPTGGNGYIIASFSSAGLGTYRWSKRSSTESIAYGVCFNGSGKTYVTGYFNGASIDFGNGIVGIGVAGKKYGFIVSFTS